MQFDCGTCILHVISRAGRPRHFPKLHQCQASANSCSIAEQRCKVTSQAPSLPVTSTGFYFLLPWLSTDLDSLVFLIIGSSDRR
jgi:hypothetical protein